MTWHSYLRQLTTAFHATAFTDGNGIRLEPDEAFATLTQVTCALTRTRKRLCLVGNGASAAMADHIAADLAKNAGVATETLANTALLTAIANDIEYPEIFSTLLRGKLETEDMVAAISSSGTSANVVNAVRYARQVGCPVITFTGMQPDNPVRSMGTLNIHVPTPFYGTVESCHAAILHHWVDCVISRQERLEQRQDKPHTVGSAFSLNRLIAQTRNMNP